jgi:hypothetical protein
MGHILKLFQKEANNMIPKNKPIKSLKRRTRAMTKKTRRPKLKAEAGETARIHQNIYARNQHGAEIAAPE